MRVMKSVYDVIKVCDVITVAEAATILNKKVQTVYYYINNEKLPLLPVEGATLLDRQDVLAFAVRGMDFSKGEENADSPEDVA